MADPTIVLRQIDLHIRILIYLMVPMGLLSALIFSMHWIIVFAGLLAWRPNENKEAEVEMTIYVVDDSSSEVHDRHSNTAPSFAGVQETHNFCVST